MIITKSLINLQSLKNLVLGSILLLSLAIMDCGFARTAIAGVEPAPVPPDPSALTGPLIGSPHVDDNLESLPPANEGSFDGGLTGTELDTQINFNQGNFRDSGGKFDIPTGGMPSPLFGAQPFTQQLLRFEEFELRPFPSSTTAGSSFPVAVGGAQGTPDGSDLESFLSQEIFPYPTREANTTDWNPWKSEIEGFLGRQLNSPPAEGRPPGQGWAHQRWEEFPPQVYLTTAQAGARTNFGFRDTKQKHGYNKGKFGSGHLYHSTTSGTPGTTNGIDIKFHPNMPIQDPKTLWTFDGTLPPKLLMARYGEPILLRHYNALPIDPSANDGFGSHTISTHEHNGHTPAESDGYTNAFFFPGQFYDYRWPMQLAGYDTVNKNAKNRRAATPCSPGETLIIKGVPKTCKNGVIKIPGDWKETMSTHWFHDHMLDFTAQNVYKGNAAMMNYYSAIDRGKEEGEDNKCHYQDKKNVNLCLPSGDALDWGNRDYDVNLLIADKSWDQEGQLWFNIFNLDGFMGDQILTNWLFKPYLDVRARRYRFRVLNGSVSRYIKVALVDEGNNPVPFYMIANDGNIMQHAIHFPGGILPTQAIAERYDIIIDFSQFSPGDKLYLVNLLEHRDGKGPNEVIPLADVLSGDYQPVIDDGRWDDGDPGVGKFMEFRVQGYVGADKSMNPARYVPGKKKMIPRPKITQADLENAIHRTFEFGRSSGTDEKPWTIKTDGGQGFGMDPRRISAAPNLGTLTEKGLGQVEIWHIENNSGGWSHPVHIHFEEGRILKRGGKAPPPWEKWARKDVYRVGPMEDSTESVEVAIRFREFAGTYMEHCHNTQHEDHAMLLRYDIEKPGQFKLMPTPIPTWDGVGYVDSVALESFRDGDIDAMLDALDP